MEQGIQLRLEPETLEDAGREVEARHDFLTKPRSSENAPGVSEEVTIPFLQRVTVAPAIWGSKPCIRRLRLPLSRLPGLLAAGETNETILKSYPYLEPEDIQEALHSAALLVDEQVTEFV